MSMSWKEWLKTIREADTSTEEDSRLMQTLLRQLGYPHARVVSGIVYAEGKGTIDSPPTSIHTWARVILEIYKDKMGHE